MKEWLNTRFFKALPETWRRALVTPYIQSTQMDVETGVPGLVTTETSKIWEPSIKELNVADTSGVWASEGKEIMLYSAGYAAEYNRRFIPGIPTADTYSDTTVDWFYEQDTDPLADGKEVKQGSLWRNSSGIVKIYYYGFWLNWGKNYVTRSVGAETHQYFRYILDTGNYFSTATSNQSHHILPCFSM